MPTPPRRPLVVFHSGCGFCRREVERLRRWDRNNRLAFLPLQDDRATTATGLSRATLEQSAHVVLPSGTVLAGAAAFRALCPHLPGGILLHALLRIPGMLPVAECVYRWMARCWGPVGGGSGQG